MRIKQCADKQWPKEYLAHSEIARRYILVGIDELKSVSQGDQEGLARQFQAFDDSQRHAAEEPENHPILTAYESFTLVWREGEVISLFVFSVTLPFEIEDASYLMRMVWRSRNIVSR